MNSITKGLEAHKALAEKRHGKGSVLSVTLYGSQNYLLDRPESDVDTHLMLIPKERDVILGKPMVTEELQADDKSICKAKDYRLMFKELLKSNVCFLELLYTNHFYVNPKYSDLFTELRNARSLIAGAQPLRLVHMVAGLCNRLSVNRPSDAKAEDLNRYGYSPRHLSQLCRMGLFLETYLDELDFANCLVPASDKRLWLTSLKTDPVCYETAMDIQKETMASVDDSVRKANLLLATEDHVEEASKYLDDLAIRIFQRMSEH